jgi:hypothetical protein
MTWGYRKASQWDGVAAKSIRGRLVHKSHSLQQFAHALRLRDCDRYACLAIVKNEAFARGEATQSHGRQRPHGRIS